MRMGFLGCGHMGRAILAGVRRLEEAGFRSAIIEAVIAASERSREMTRQR